MASTKTYSHYGNYLSRLERQRKIEYEKIKYLTGIYKQNIRKISKKIKLARRQLSRVREREWKVRYMKRIAEEFTNTNLDCSNTSRKASQGRNLVYKYALERRITGNVVAEIFGCKPSIPSRQRTRFTRSFKDHPEHRDTWNRFNIFVREYLIDKHLDPL